MSGTQDTRDAYVARFAAANGALPGGRLSWLTKLRGEAIGRFAETGFPTRKVEAWKFTDLRTLAEREFAPAPRRANGFDAAAVAGLLPAGVGGHRLVFVNGHYRPDLSEIKALPEGAHLLSLGEALDTAPELVEGRLSSDGSGPAALNAAFMTDGAVLVLDDGVTLVEPVHVLCLGSGEDAGTAAHLRNVVALGAGAGATLIETYAAPGDAAEGDAGHWTNVVSDISVGAGARLHHVKLQAEAVDVIHLAANRVRLDSGSIYDSFVVSTGARLSRNEIDAALDGSGIECRLTGAYLARGNQHMDTTTVVDHARPGSYSNEHYRGVLDDHAHGVFQGRIVVRPDAQQTDAHQLNKNLLLSETAQVDTKPELEIRADDVKCSHGATVGELDAEALFYMRARGLDATAARRLLVEAFVGEIVDGVEGEALRDHLRTVVAGWLPGDARNGEARHG